MASHKHCPTSTVPKLLSSNAFFVGRRLERDSAEQRATIAATMRHATPRNGARPGLKRRRQHQQQQLQLLNRSSSSRSSSNISSQGREGKTPVANDGRCEHRISRAGQTPPPAAAVHRRRRWLCGRVVWPRYRLVVGSSKKGCSCRYWSAPVLSENLFLEGLCDQQRPPFNESRTCGSVQSYPHGFIRSINME